MNCEGNFNSNKRFVSSSWWYHTNQIHSPPTQSSFVFKVTKRLKRNAKTILQKIPRRNSCVSQRQARKMLCTECRKTNIQQWTKVLMYVWLKPFWYGACFQRENVSVLYTRESLGLNLIKVLQCLIFIEERHPKFRL